eukprot:9053236-Alexandrium_andersonii.AAC.1
MGGFGLQDVQHFGRRPAQISSAAPRGAAVVQVGDVVVAHRLVAVRRGRAGTQATGAPRSA